MQNNDVHTHNAKADISKYFYHIRSNFKLGFGYRQNELTQILNEELIDISIHNLHIGGKADVEFTDWFNISYSYKLTKFFNKLAESSNRSVTEQNHALQLHLYLKDNHYIGSETSYIKNNLYASTNENVFGDLLYRYSLKVKNIDFELRWQNIFNTKEYKTVSISDYSYVETNRILRPSQVRFKV